MDTRFRGHDGLETRQRLQGAKVFCGAFLQKSDRLPTAFLTIAASQQIHIR
jgi:hypothetical protein